MNDKLEKAINAAIYPHKDSPIVFTILNVTNNTSKKYTKSNNEKGYDVKVCSAAEITGGLSVVCKLDTPKEHFDYIQELKNDTGFRSVLISGTPKNTKQVQNLVSSKYENAQNISRTKKNFHYEPNCIVPVLLDVDGLKNSLDAHFQALKNINPELDIDNLALSIFPSNSCGIYSEEDVLLTHQNKFHAYLYAFNCDKITKEGRTNLIKRLIINGDCVPIINKIGQFSLGLNIDITPYLQPERLEFFQNPILEGGLYNKPFEASFKDGNYIDLSLPCYTQPLSKKEEELYQATYSMNKRNNSKLIEQSKSEALRGKTKEFITLDKLDEKTAKIKAKKWLNDLHRGVVRYDTAIKYKDGTLHTVESILNDIETHKESSIYYGNNKFYPVGDENRYNPCAGFRFKNGKIIFSSFSKITYRIIKDKTIDNFNIKDSYSISSITTHKLKEIIVSEFRDFMLKNKIIINTSSMGVGKTQLIKKLQETIGKKVVYLTSNIALAKNGSSVLELQLYSDKGIEISNDNIACCINSIIKYVTANSNTILVLDEFTQIKKAISLGTVGESKGTDSKKAVLDYLKDLIKISKNVLILDADANENTINFLKLINETDIKVINVKNQYQKVKASFTKDVLKTEQLLIDKINVGKVCAVAMDCKDRAVVLAETIKLKTSKNVLLITGDTVDLKEQYEFLKNPIIPEDTVLIFSPVITTGVNILTPIDVMLGFSDNIITIQQTGQQCGRCRIVRDEYIFCLIGHTNSRETDKELLLNDLKEQGVLGDIILKHEAEFHHKKFDWHQETMIDDLRDNNIFLNMSFEEKIEYLNEKYDFAEGILLDEYDNKDRIKVINKELQQTKKDIRQELDNKEIMGLTEARILNDDEYLEVKAKTIKDESDIFNLKKTDLSKILYLDELTESDIMFGMSKSNIDKMHNLIDAQLDEINTSIRNNVKLNKGIIDGKDYISKKAATKHLEKILGFKFTDLENINFTIDNPLKVYKAIINKREVFIKAGLIDKRGFKEVIKDNPHQTGNSLMLTNITTLLSRLGVEKDKITNQFFINKIILSYTINKIKKSKINFIRVEKDNLQNFKVDFKNHVLFKKAA